MPSLITKRCIKSIQFSHDGELVCLDLFSERSLRAPGNGSPLTLDNSNFTSGIVLWADAKKKTGVRNEVEEFCTSNSISSSKLMKEMKNIMYHTGITEDVLEELNSNKKLLNKELAKNGRPYPGKLVLSEEAKRKLKSPEKKKKSKGVIK